MTASSEKTTAVAHDAPRRGWLMTFGRIAVTLAIMCAGLTLLIFADYTPISPTNNVVLSLFAANAIFILVLVGLLVAEILRLVRARRAQVAGAGLHFRIVALFSIIAAAPAILIAVVGSITVERTFNPGFMKDLRGFITNTAEVARLFGESHCRALLRETRLTAADLDRLQPIFNANKPLFIDFFNGRSRFLNFASAALIKRDGTVVMRGTGPKSRVVIPRKGDFDEAERDEPTCLILDAGRTLVAVRKMQRFPDTFLYVERAVDKFVVEFPARATALVSLFNAFDARRTNIQIAFAVMYALIALILLLSASWLGLSFANRLVHPIRRLIAATDQVSAGNLYVQVPVNRSEGDLAKLGETFNNMTTELRQQQNRLMEASRINDERRLFTEAVLSGVPAGVIGVNNHGEVSVLNPYAQDLIQDVGGIKAEEAIGRRVDDIIPELADIMESARNAPMRVQQGQVTLSRHGRDRTYNVRLANEQAPEAERNQVITLDDITDLVTAQRTSAWADVARRIAHEIKNPLTPIQLSAERLKRKYGRVITEDRAVFDQCVDTIVRQVDDIKRMVDEFSSFARMPRARLQEDDLVECVRQIVFLMRVGHPDIEIEDHLPSGPMRANFDRRLLSQALTNIIKNATEGIKGAETHIENPRIGIFLGEGDGGMVFIDVIDNGKGFPKENRQRLLEPYMTTRSEGTGLGLPIVAKILEDHGGGIELYDAPEGQGAWVRLYLLTNMTTPEDGEDRPATQPAAKLEAVSEGKPIGDPALDFDSATDGKQSSDAAGSRTPGPEDAPALQDNNGRN